MMADAGLLQFFNRWRLFVQHPVPLIGNPNSDQQFKAWIESLINAINRFLGELGNKNEVMGEPLHQMRIRFTAMDPSPEKEYSNKLNSFFVEALENDV